MFSEQQRSAELRLDQFLEVFIIWSIWALYWTWPHPGSSCLGTNSCPSRCLLGPSSARAIPQGERSGLLRSSVIHAFSLRTLHTGWVCPGSPTNWTGLSPDPGTQGPSQRMPLRLVLSDFCLSPLQLLPCLLCRIMMGGILVILIALNWPKRTWYPNILRPPANFPWALSYCQLHYSASHYLHQLGCWSTDPEG